MVPGKNRGERSAGYARSAVAEAARRPVAAGSSAAVGLVSGRGLGVKYVCADATGPLARYLSRNYRHWLWIGDVILVIDDVLAHEPGRFDWLLHYEGSAEAKDNQVSIASGEAKAVVHFLYPARLELREEEGLAEHQPTRKVKYLAMSAESRFRDQKFVTAIVPHPAAATVELLATAGDSTAESQEIRGSPGGQRSISSKPDRIGVRIRHGSDVTDVYLNINADGRRMHVNTNNILDGWDTDAYLLALTRPADAAAATPENVSRYFVACASYLRKGGRVVLSSLAKIDAAVRPGKRPEIALHGPETAEAEILAAERTNSVIVNGSAAPARFDQRRKLAAFRTGRT